MDAGHGFLNVQIAHAPLFIATIPVIESKGGVARLLNFGHEHASAYGVYRSGRQKDAIAWLRAESVQALLEATGFESDSESGFVNARQEARVDAAGRSPVDDVPGLGLAAFLGT
jgi:hypothetical protein